MFAFVTRRVLVGILTLAIFSFAIFSILYQSGDPTASLRQTAKLDPTVVQELLEQNGFNDPFLERYVNWVKGFVTGDWGTSFKDQAPAFDEITSKLGATVELLGVALIVTLIIAVPLGVLGATRRYSTFDNVTTGFAYVGFATPTFFVGLLLQLMAVSLNRNGWGMGLFILGLVVALVGAKPLFRNRWIPTAAIGAVMIALGAVYWSYNQGTAIFATGKRTTPYLDEGLWSVDHLQHLILPVMTITVISIATWSRYLRSSMLDVLSQDYLRTARAKGVGERSVIYRHALRNGTLPLITIMAIDAAGFFQGAVVTETVFSWDGIGSRLVQAVREQDIPIAMGIVMIGAVMVVMFNIIADIAYSIADPRIRLS